MNIADPNVLLVESVARAMGPLCKEVVFVGSVHRLAAPGELSDKHVSVEAEGFLLVVHVDGRQLDFHSSLLFVTRARYGPSPL